MDRLEVLEKLQHELIKNGQIQLANLIKPYVKNKDDLVTIAIVGEMLKGKSTFINNLLGKNLVPVTPLPTDCVICLMPSEQDIVIDANGKEHSLQEINSLVNINKKITIEVNNALLSSNRVMITEYPGMIPIDNANDFLSLSDIFRNDFIILILAADQLLSLTESNFLDNFIKLIDKDRILVVINKLNLINVLEEERLLNYAQKVLQTRFPGINYGILTDKKNLPVVDKNVLIGIQQIKALLTKNITSDRLSILCNSDNVLKTIKGKLEKEYTELKKLAEEKQKLDKESLKKEQNEKEMELVLLEKIFIEFKQRHNATAFLMQDFIDKQFGRAEKDILSQFKSTSDKRVWCEKVFPQQWKKHFSNFTIEIDETISPCVYKDIKWLLMQLESNKDVDSVIKFDNCLQNNIPPEIREIESYDLYQKYLPAGIIGCSVLGFCFSRSLGIVTFVTCSVAHKIILHDLLTYKINEQDKRVENIIKEEIQSQKEILSKNANKKLSEFYDNVLRQLKQDREKFIDTHYLMPNKENSSDGKTTTIGNLLKLVEEALKCH